MEEKLGLHKINITDRNNILISGVSKVVNSNENCIIVRLKECDLSILGTKLNIENFNENNISIDGVVDSIKYSKPSKEKESIIKRIFK